MAHRRMRAAAIEIFLVLSSSSLLTLSQTCQLQFDAQYLERRYSFAKSDPWIDSTGSGNDLTAVNLPAGAIVTSESDECPPNMGDCISFGNDATSQGLLAGNAQHVKIPKLHTDTFKNGITYAFWVKFDKVSFEGFAPQNGVFSFFGTSSPTDHAAIFSGRPEPFFDSAIYQPFVLQTSKVWLSPIYCSNELRQEKCEEQYPIPGGWHHVAWAMSQLDGTRIYVDGLELTDQFEEQLPLGSPLLTDQLPFDSPFDIPFDIPSDPFFEFKDEEFEGQIGASTSPGSFHFNGKVDDFRIYSTALSPDQAWDLYTNNCTVSDDICNAQDISFCSVNAICAKSDGVATCLCREGYEDKSGDGSLCEDIDECNLEEVAGTCHELAYCDNFGGGFRCVCPAGFLGNGTFCQSGSFGIRSVINFPPNTQLDVTSLKFQYARALLPQAEVISSSDIVTTLAASVGATDEGLVQLTLNALFYTQDDAAATLAALSSPDALALGGTIVDGPEVYRWTAQSTSDPIAIRPTGLSVDSVHFDPACKQSGCWVIGVTYSKGSDNFNVFYLPRADGRDDLSYDPDYTAVVPEWNLSPADTFSPQAFPCGSNTYDPASYMESLQLPPHVSACCLPAFLAMYRPVSSFPAALENVDLSVCDGSEEETPMFVKKGASSDPASKMYDQPDAQSLVDGVFIGSTFSGMAHSEIVSAGTVDPYVGIFKAILYLDEKELRTQAGQRRGTVGVQHTVDTFVGLASFNPTGIKFLDSSASQVALHLEKTDFFSVSSHGTNAYTFLDYVNMRLIAIFQQDTDQSESAAEMGARTTRTDPTAAHYVQVTFNLGSKYKPNPSTGIVPVESVRVGAGSSFPASTFMEHPCQAYVANPPTFAAKDVFDSRFPSADSQQCAPNTKMCVNPETTPGNFVSFNIPLGIDWLPNPASDLSSNVFVEMMVSVVDVEQEEPEMTKTTLTTLTSTVPIVEGAVNVFCDGITAKTDLTDAVTVDLILGTAASSTDLSSLRRVLDIGTSVLQPKEPTDSGSNSIEDGLMTLLVRGNPSYFGLGGTGAYGINVEDVITLHIMETTDSHYQAVQNLIAVSGDDNVVDNQLDTDGYRLNGAFSFSVDRANNRAYLDPTPELLALCRFRPPRPSVQNPFPSVCVLRRDIHRQSFAENGQGSSRTAIEVDAMDVARDDREDNAVFLQNILGSSTYAYNLGKDFSHTLANTYSLNGRFNRAIWIDPAYQWTPEQTGGKKRFEISAKILLFALINLDEGLVRTQGNQNGGGRRMLLASTKDSGASVSAATVTYNTSPTYIFSKAFKVPEEKVAVFDVVLHLNLEQACKTSSQLRPELSDALVGHLSATASPIAGVQMLSLNVDKGPVQCRRSLRGLKAVSEATARVEMLVMFSVNFDAALDIDRFVSIPSVVSISPVTVSSSVALGPYAPQDMEYWSIATQRPTDKGKESGGSVNIGVVIAGVGGGIAILLTIGIFYYLFKQRRQPPPIKAEELRRQSAESLKTDLHADLQIPLHVVNIKSTLSVDDILEEPPKRKHKPPRLEFAELAGKKEYDAEGNRVSPVALARKELVSSSIRDLGLPDNLHSSLSSDEMRLQLNDCVMDINDSVMEI